MNVTPGYVCQEPSNVTRMLPTRRRRRRILGQMVERSPEVQAEMARLKKAFGKRVTLLRKRRWPRSRGPLADLMDIGEHGLGRWERGEVYPDTYYDLIVLASHLGVTTDCLLTGDTRSIDTEIVQLLTKARLAKLT